jgi:hypothetical protein
VRDDRQRMSRMTEMKVERLCESLIKGSGASAPTNAKMRVWRA